MSSIISANFGTATALTITLASLASSAAGVGRQSTLVDNTTTQFQKIHLYWKIATGTTPTVSTPISIYLLKADKASSADTITDGAGASDAGLTVVSAKQIDGTVVSATSNVEYQGDCVINNPGPCWGVAVVQGTGAALNATGGNHAIWFVGENPIAN